MPSNSATQSCRKLTAGIRQLVAKAGKPKRTHTPPVINQDLYNQIVFSVSRRLSDALDTSKYEKLESYHRVR